MSVAGTTAAAASTTKSSTSLSTTSLGKEDFLKLLVAQLKYQDPLDPQKPDQFVSQLAQFSQLEQLTNMSSSLDGMVSKNASSQWISSIGKRVNVTSSTLSPGDQVVISPQTDYDKVVLTMKDNSTGETTTKTMYKGESLVYTNSSESSYTISAKATKDGSAVSAVTTLLKKITGVSMSDTGNMLVFGDGTALNASAVTVITE